MCCISGRRPWWCCINGGDVESTLVYGVTIDGCITSIDFGSTIGSDGLVGVMDNSVVYGVTSTLGSCTGGGV